MTNPLNPVPRKSIFNSLKTVMVGKVLVRLGKGGIDVVWKARDSRLNGFVVLRTWFQEVARTPRGAYA